MGTLDVLSSCRERMLWSIDHASNNWYALGEAERNNKRYKAFNKINKVLGQKYNAISARYRRDQPN
jgi:hypothetical protein